MAELDMTASDCCSEGQRATCCDPSEKAGCCGHGEGCGCETEASAAPFGAGLVDVEIRSTHRVHDKAPSAIVRARKPSA